MKSTIDHDHSIGDKVYLRSDSDNTERYITGILLRQYSNIQYEFSSSNMTGWHYGFEISTKNNLA